MNEGVKKSKTNTLWLNLLHLYSYGSIHIALCAYLFTQFSFHALKYRDSDYYSLLVAFGTFTIYSIHRYVGIQLLNDEVQKEGRYAIIKNHKQHIKVYAVLGFLVSTFLYFNQSNLVKILMLVPCLMALAYVSPIFPSGKRLRDFNFGKIFFIAFSWTLLCRSLPLIQAAAPYPFIINSSVSNFLFMFAITLPFDLRDETIDKGYGVKTLAHVLTNENAILVCSTAIIIAMGIEITSFTSIDNLSYTLSVESMYIVTLIVIYFSKKMKNDFYYTLLMDGLMMLFLATYYLWLYIVK